MPTNFYDNATLTEILTDQQNQTAINLNRLTNQQLGSLIDQTNVQITQATFPFWRNVQTGCVTQTATAALNDYDNQWPVWVQACDDNATTWTTWTTGGGTIYMPPHVLTFQGAPVLYDAQPTPAQEVENARYRAELRRADDAATRARVLLESLLTDAQRASLHKHRHFDLVGSSGKRYRIRDGSHGNVRLLDAGGKEIGQYCGQPVGVPVADMMLAQKLQIETDEAEFLRLANRLDRVAA